MKRQPNKKFVGAFVLAGIVAFLAILIIAFGAGYRNRNKDLYVMYFHESIKGLSIGSPVVLSGVEVGKVVTKNNLQPGRSSGLVRRKPGFRTYSQGTACAADKSKPANGSANDRTGRKAGQNNNDQRGG